ncbi:hypothetical protein E3N88_43876 [Mikania micrantha]|uniref:DDE Tnp4 domain-containing protein n=1 Tax=Mikania micrantha TaxID=192012 RepID=A0A5N6LDP1_9ASTR|nr:hypothetical protein E3N88_43876 [Mikania micrantha]
MATKRSRISWKQEVVVKTFLESCVNELTLHGREGGSLKALSWKKGATSNGFDNWGPSSTLPHPFEDISEHNLNDFEDIECTQMDPPHKVVSEESSGHSKKELKKRKAKETINSQIMEVGEHIMNLAKMLIENQKASNDMEACMTKLGTMGWAESDPKYQTALLLFGESADIRKVWLQLQPQTCELWVKNAGAKYWLADFRRQRVLTKEEKFNRAHAQLRNVIERSYGVLKARFPILKQMDLFSFPIQRDIVIACFAVHNFIRRCNIHDLLFMEYDENSMFAETQPQGEPSEGHSIHDIDWGSQSNEYMNSLRDHIASHLA